jgi:hypothetical protein
MQLDAAIIEARGIADEFNSRASLSRVRIYVMCGRIAPDDVEAVKAINSEVRELLSEMTEGVKKFDVKRIRDVRIEGEAIGLDAARRMRRRTDPTRGRCRPQLSPQTCPGWRDGREGSGSLCDATAQGSAHRVSSIWMKKREVRAPKAQGRAIDLEPETKPTQAA